MTTTLHDDLAVRLGEDARWWLALAACALVGVLACTAVLGGALAPRWPDAWSWSALKPDRQARVQPPASSRAQPDAAAPAIVAAETPAGTPREPAAPRAKAYSTVDTRTLAEARLREDLVAGKRDASSAAAPPIVSENVPATVGPASVTESAKPPAGMQGAKPAAGSASDTARLARPSAVRSLPDAAPRNTTPARVELAARDPRIDTAGRSPARGDVAKGDDVNPALARATAPALDPSRTVAGSRDTTRTREPVSIAQRSPASIGRQAGTEVATASPRSPQPDLRLDATTRELDELWERRERWLRERLQARPAQR